MPSGNTGDANPILRFALPLFAGLLAVSFAWIVPLGEAPDELAHIRYAESLAKGRLPSLEPGSIENYEAHQPPLGYVLPALVIALRGGLELHPERDPALDFEKPGSRAFRNPFAHDRDLLTLRIARSFQATWVVVAVWIAMRMAPSTSGAAPFLLVPQLLFLGGAIGNDAALVAWASGALAAISRFAKSGDSAVAAATLTTLALFTKASALFLLAPITVAVTVVPVSTGADARRRRIALLGATAAGMLLWLGFNLLRTGSPLPHIPTSHRLATLSEMLLDPTWLGGLFASYWGKFGWLNTPLPAPFYVWFGVLSLLVLRLARARPVLLCAIVGNVVLLFAYQLLVDRQAQGRYLLPSLAAVAAIGSEGIPERLRSIAAAIAMLVALLSVEVARRAFA